MSLHQSLSWVFPYMNDWGACGHRPTPLRAYTTVLRWYANPTDRTHQLLAIRSYIGDEAWRIPPRLEANLNDLVDADAALSPALDAAAFGLFLEALQDGDFDDGSGPEDDDLYDLDPIRPGFPFALRRWQWYFDGEPMPWPFWVFPVKAT